jgi:hypothetical protein
VTHYTSAAKGKIDLADRARGAVAGATIDGMIFKAANYWATKKIKGALILTPGQPQYLHLFAYLLASWNRYESNEATFQAWLQGGVVKTKNGPAGGFHLTAPPMIVQMHKFFSSLRIWDGTQGKYSNLRDRMDPTLARIGA